MDAVYVAANQFSVVGDLTASFITNRRVKVDCGVDGIKYANITSSSYSNPNTTITIGESTLTSNTTSAWYGVVQPGEDGSLPIHSHTTAEGDGGEISASLPSTLSGTSLYIDGDATVTGTMYAHVYDSYSPLTVKDGGVTVIAGTGSGSIDFPNGITVEGSTISGGTVIHTAAGPPPAENYNAGDYYIDNLNNDIYTKEEEASANATFLLLSNTTDGSVTFTDSSPSDYTIVATGGVHHEDTQKKFGLTSIYFDGDDDWLTVSSIVLPLTSDTFTIDTWIYQTASNGASDRQLIIGDSEPGIPNSYWSFGLDNNDKLTFQWWDGAQRTAKSTNAVTLNAWNHIAVTVDSNAIRLFINGTQETIVGLTTLTNRTGTNTLLTVGTSNNYHYAGYIDDLRIVVGTAEWTTNFTPYTSSYLDPWNRVLTTSEGGSSTFLELDDTPSTYSGTEGQYLISTGSGTEFTDITEWHYGEDAPATEFGSVGDYYLDTISGSIHTKTSEIVGCSSYTSDLTTEGYTIGTEYSSYTGGAFDNVINDANATGSWYSYYSAAFKPDGWTGQDFGSGNDKAIAKYRIYSDNANTAAKTWTFEASVSGTWTGEEVILDTQTDYAFTASIAWHDFEFYNETDYRYYRLNVSANNGNTTYLVIREIEMMECTSEASPGGWSKLVAPGEIVYDSLKLRAPDESVWELKVTNSGTLYTAEVT